MPGAKGNIRTFKVRAMLFGFGTVCLVAVGIAYALSRTLLAEIAGAGVTAIALAVA